MRFPLVSRARALATVCGAAAVSAGCGGHGTTKPVTLSFRSRPDLHPPVVTVSTHSPKAAAGDIFIAPKKNAPQYGAEILDGRGRLVWFRPGIEVTDFRVQTYRGQRVLTWWEGPPTAPVHGTGRGSYVIMNSSYHVVARVQAGFGTNTGDLHEFKLTPSGTALLTAYRVVHRDLTAFGGPADGRVADSVVQEVDVATGHVLFTWHSLGHVALAESYTQAPTGSSVWNYFHVNSIDLEPDGDLLVSARNTHAVYEIDPRTGRVLWRLGGKRSSFAMGAGTTFAWQHDARRQPDGTITIFDDESPPAARDRSRAIRLRLDTATHRATLVQADSLPGVRAVSQGNVQQLANGDLFVGWGAVPRFTEFSPSGKVVFDATFSAGDDSYRAYRFAWTGTPTTRPSIAVTRGGAVYASWNGATEVARWRVLAGPRAGGLRPVASAARTGFETALRPPDRSRLYAVAALDARGDVLGVSAAVERGGASVGQS